MNIIKFDVYPRFIRSEFFLKNNLNQELEFEKEIYFRNFDFERKIFLKKDFEFASYLLKDSIKNWKIISNGNITGVNSFISKKYFLEEVTNLKNTNAIKYEMILNYSIDDLIKCFYYKTGSQKMFDTSIATINFVESISFENQCLISSSSNEIPANIGINIVDCHMKAIWPMSPKPMLVSTILYFDEETETNFCIFKSCKESNSFNEQEEEEEEENNFDSSSNSLLKTKFFSKSPNSRISKISFPNVKIGSPESKISSSPKVKNEPIIEATCFKVFSFRKISENKTHFSLIDITNLGSWSSKFSQLEFLIKEKAINMKDQLEKKIELELQIDKEKIMKSNEFGKIALNFIKKK